MNLRYPVLIILFFVIYPVFGSTIDSAISLENSGDIRGARIVYRTWLEENPGGPGYADVLLHSASLAESASDSISLILSFIGKVPAQDSYNLYARVAAMESAVGRLSESAAHYTLASAIGGSAGELWSLDALILNFKMGEYHQTELSAMVLHRKAELQRVRDESLALAAACMAYDGRKTEALRILEEYASGTDAVQAPLVWFEMRNIALSDGNSDAAEKAVRFLAEIFPNSVNHYLAGSRVLEWLSPAGYIEGFATGSGMSVQVAAFVSRKRSASLRTRLENDGFTAWIEQQDEIWKVYVNDPDGNAVSRLRDAGYDSLF